MRTAAHSCLMSRKSLGAARTTAASTELNESADAEDASDASAPPSPALALDAADDELRHSRGHLRPPLCPAAFRATSDLIHLLDASIDPAQCKMQCNARSRCNAATRLFLCSTEASAGLCGGSGQWEVEEGREGRTEGGGGGEAEARRVATKWKEKQSVK
jgi:hypothetical protein